MYRRSACQSNKRVLNLSLYKYLPQRQFDHFDWAPEGHPFQLVAGFPGILWLRRPNRSSRENVSLLTWQICTDLSWQQMNGRCVKSSALYRNNYILLYGTRRLGKFSTPLNRHLVFADRQTPQTNVFDSTNVCKWLLTTVETIPRQRMCIRNVKERKK